VPAPDIVVTRVRSARKHNAHNELYARFRHLRAEPLPGRRAGRTFAGTSRLTQGTAHYS
jgi:hypothetical protein